MRTIITNAQKIESKYILASVIEQTLVNNQHTERIVLSGR
jgi:hypothetical protein